MRSNRYRLGGLATAVGLLIWFAAGQIVLAQQVRFRDLVLRKDKAELAKALGVSEVKSVLALEYRVLLCKNDQWETVDPKIVTFRIGDCIRLEVKPFQDSYIYIYYEHEGEGGSRAFLMPEPGDSPPLVKGGSAVKLPEGESCIEFIAPPGVEKVYVVAAKEPVPDLDLLAATITTAPEQLTPDQVATKEKLYGTSDAILESFSAEVDRTGKKVNKLRGIPGGATHEKMREQIRRNGADRIVIEEPASRKGEGTAGILVSTGKEDASDQNLQVTIPLRSVGSSSESG